MSDDTKTPLSELFKDLPERASVQAFDRGDACGFVVSWCEPGYGFGQFTFGLDKKTRAFFGDTECTDTALVGRILARLPGTVVEP
jgi:hypothetical protein